METRVYSWGDGRPWHSYAAYCRRHFGGRVRKIAVDAGLSCPNRDGTIGSEGCTFCDNRAFTPSYCSPRKSLTRQIDEGIAFHAARGRDEGLCLVYFQPFSNTHAPVARLRELYAEALAHPRISGLVIGTRPDCVDDEKLDLLAELARKRYVAVEYGVESTCDETLRAVRRGHDFAAARQAIAASAARGLHVGAHFILGLPGEDDEMLLRQVERINAVAKTVTAQFTGSGVNELIRLYRQRINQKKIDEDFLIYAMDSVDIRIFNLHNEDGKKMHAGSTCVMLALQKRGMYCLSVGDSRLYLLRNNAIAQLTRDHTVALKAENDYRLEKISYDEYLKLSEDKSTLCSYFGLGGIEIYDLNKELYELNKNDILVAVTDGLYKSLNVNEIKDILLKNRDVKSMAEQLIHKAALFAKGKNQDNTTVAICRIR